MEKPPDYYQLLGLEGSRNTERLSATELKSAYRRALLQHHPDKNAQAVKTSPRSQSEKPQISVDDVALAYKVLSEPELRAEYDFWLRSKGKDGKRDGIVHRTGLETVDLDDLIYDQAASFWYRSCRCGEDRGYVVTELELEKNITDGELIVGCKGCSLWLRVLFGVEE